MKILIDNGHGRETPGKCSPDGRFREFEYNRLIARAVVLHLQYRDYDAALLVPESIDIPLPERVKRVNAYCDEHGADQVCVVSIHVNAAGSDGKWHSATGWSCYSSRGQTTGDKLADAQYAAAERQLDGHNIRKDFSDGDADLESDFYLLKHTHCAAVLSENGFMDSALSLRYLESDEGKIAICNLHVEGIINYVEQLKNQQQ